MHKRGLGFIWLIFIIIVVGVIISSIIYFTVERRSETAQQNGTQTGETNASANQTAPGGATMCSNYETQDACEADSSNIGVLGHGGWSETGCDNNETECGCVWDANTTSCKLGIVNESSDGEKKEGIFFDLASINLTLENDGCIGGNETNSSGIYCNLSITGVFKNIGTEAINIEFLVYIIDATDTASFIDIITISTGLAVEAEKTISSVYLNIAPETYWVQMKVDSTNLIGEKDEDNNNIAKQIEVK